MEALLAELEAALAYISARIERWKALQRVADSESTKASLRNELESMERRRNLINASIQALHNLENDGYPAVPQRVLTDEECDDLNVDADLINKAIAEDIICPTIGTESVEMTVGPQRPAD